MVDNKNEFIIMLQNELIAEKDIVINEITLENKTLKREVERLGKYEKLYLEHIERKDSGC